MLTEGEESPRTESLWLSPNREDSVSSPDDDCYFKGNYLIYNSFVYDIYLDKNISQKYKVLKLTTGLLLTSIEGKNGNKY